MPAGHGHLCLDEDASSSDDVLENFEEDTCKSCDFYFEEYTDSNVDLEDDDGNPAICVTYKSRCRCKVDGIDYVRWPCPAGYDDPTIAGSVEAEGPMPPMTYAVDLYPTSGTLYSSTACMQACDAEAQLVSASYRSMNTYSDGTVCWGNDNDAPETLSEIVEQYIGTVANEDLLKVHEYLDNRRRLKNDVPRKPISGLVIPPGCDAALMVSAAYQPAAFLLLRGTGYPSCDGVLAVGLRRHSLRHDGQWLDGYCTTVIDGRCWFVLPNPDATEDPDLQYQALLLSQIPDPFSACSSPAPSSLAPVALAAS